MCRKGGQSGSNEFVLVHDREEDSHTQHKQCVTPSKAPNPHVILVKTFFVCAGAPKWCRILHQKSLKIVMDTELEVILSLPAPLVSLWTVMLRRLYPVPAWKKRGMMLKLLEHRSGVISLKKNITTTITFINLELQLGVYLWSYLETTITLQIRRSKFSYSYIMKVTCVLHVASQLHILPRMERSV